MWFITHLYLYQSLCFPIFISECLHLLPVLLFLPSLHSFSSILFLLCLLFYFLLLHFMDVSVISLSLFFPLLSFIPPLLYTNITSLSISLSIYPSRLSLSLPLYFSLFHPLYPLTFLPFTPPLLRFPLPLPISLSVSFCLSRT